MKIIQNKMVLDKIIRKHTREVYKSLWDALSVLKDIPEHTELTVVKNMLPDIINMAGVEKTITDSWVKTATKFAIDTQKAIKEKKSMQLDFWEELFELYYNQRSLLKFQSIKNSLLLSINKVIDDIVAQSLAGGVGAIGKQSQVKILMQELNKIGVEMLKWQAERITRTELVGAGNRGSFEAVKQSGMDVKKKWLTSGLPNVRDTHQEYEFLDFVEMNYEYAPGLHHPGDADGAPEEVINCRCTIIWDVN